MVKEKKTGILVVDDEKKIVDVVQSYLEKNGYEVFAAYEGKQALELFEKHNPALIVLDLMLPDLSGQEICQIIRKKSRVPIIMLTAKVEEEDILAGLGLGADDYMTKPFSPRQLIARVNAILRRTEDETGLLADKLSFYGGELEVDFPQRKVMRSGEPVLLTPTEFNILQLLIKHPQRVYNREELIYYAMGEDYEGFDRVVDTHIKNLRQKVEKEPKSPKYILTVHGVGYTFGKTE